ncbi:excalibur calcium-binding domain-containing protein [Kribbella sp. VKM Ac-2568]|nr:excalibur calcium-binding domain-containing protein [Kribbella sp. VKM Ac-2568]
MSPAVTYASCAEVRAAGKAPLHRGDPGYSRELDRNGDGVACDRGNS